VVDNRSTYSRSNNFHTLYATGSGTWAVSMSYSDTACTGPWTPFGSPTQITQASAVAVIAGIGYHPFIQIAVSGSASVTYAAAKDFFPATFGPTGPSGVGVPSGGATGYALTKTSGADFATGWTQLTKGLVGLPNADNTSDATKPVSTAQQAALDLKAAITQTIYALASGKADSFYCVQTVSGVPSLVAVNTGNCGSGGGGAAGGLFDSATGLFDNASGLFDAH
jgi:hypothetical protein